MANYLKPERRAFESRFTRLDTSAKIFDEGVAISFDPLAQRLKLPLRKMAEGVYEIPGRFFALRIRKGTGHTRDFLVTLLERASISETSGSPRDLCDGEIGLRVIAAFYGEKLGPHMFHTREGYLRAFEDESNAAEKFAAPFLLDLRSNFGDIRQFVARKVEEAGIRDKDYRFPPNVRKEWL